MSRRSFGVFVVLPVATLAAYLMARGLLSDDWQKFIYVENGPIELGTAILFAVASAMALALCHKRRCLPGIYCGLFLLFAGFSAFVALEEISYGQQLFGWASPEWFEQNNHHGQTNLHNLMGNRPSHVLKKVGNYGTLFGFVFVPAVAGCFKRAYRAGHWTYYLLPRMELVVVTAVAQLCSFLWDNPESLLSEYWHQGWNEVRELVWGMAAVLYVMVIRERVLASSRGDEIEQIGTDQGACVNNAA